MLAVLSIFSLLYKQAIQVSTRGPGTRVPGIGLRTPWWRFFQGPCVQP